ncbi:hypothetical protein EJ08DRAFT_731728 [Tothia fuscella]|uniref:Uncharacterized protein n=1 Tax=Tothia fuscella TaxID=1048955 RepID=A0A9P4NW37_9PEZI|nr:hypothetical protein EJ08DRAFT_731728 [Tothia fuscella]
MSGYAYNLNVRAKCDQKSLTFLCKKMRDILLPELYRRITVTISLDLAQRIAGLLDPLNPGLHHIRELTLRIDLPEEYENKNLSNFHHNHTNQDPEFTSGVLPQFTQWLIQSLPQDCLHKFKWDFYYPFPSRAGRVLLTRQSGLSATVMPFALTRPTSSSQGQPSKDVQMNAQLVEKLFGGLKKLQSLTVRIHSFQIPFAYSEGDGPRYNFGLGDLADFFKFQSGISRTTKCLHTLHILNWPTTEDFDNLRDTFRYPYHNFAINNIKSLLRDQASIIYRFYRAHRVPPVITIGMNDAGRIDQAWENEAVPEHWATALCFRRAVYVAESSGAEADQLIVARQVKVRDLADAGYAMDLIEVNFDNTKRRRRYRAPANRHEEQEELSGSWPEVHGPVF